LAQRVGKVGKSCHWREKLCMAAAQPTLAHKVVAVGEGGEEGKVGGGVDVALQDRGLQPPLLPTRGRGIQGGTHVHLGVDWHKWCQLLTECQPLRSEVLLVAAVRDTLDVLVPHTWYVNQW
jgi:hypothetical protein